MPKQGEQALILRITKTTAINTIRYVLNPVRLLYCVYALLLFILLMLLVFPVVVIASVRGKIKGGNVIYALCRFWTDCWMACIGIRHQNIGGDRIDANRQYIFIANHISYLDIPLILKSIRHHPLRVLGKHEMKRVPIFGFIYRSAVVMVDRSDPNARSKSVRILKSVLNRGISIFIYPEGTFNETHAPLKDFYDGAFRIAIETQTPIKPLLFLDTYTRMHYDSIFSLTPGRSRTVFMDEIPVAGLGHADVEKLKKAVYEKMDATLRSYEAPWIESPGYVQNQAT